MQGYDTKDTICALATPEGVGAIGVVRLSGDKAIDISNALFPSKELHSVPSHTVHVGNFGRDDAPIDEVVLTIFKNPKSYTGEDIVEISCHGSNFIQSEIMKALVAEGARMAKEGEFTFRAFINGKLDLSQAEAVADLIASDSEFSRDLALSQLKGGYASRLKEMRDQLIHFASMLELELDFSEEDVEFANRDELKGLITELSTSLEQMIESFDRGNVFKHGIPVAIIGAPNVGKSTLLNKVLNEERAIVSEIAGTTRDYIEDVFNINGILFRFIDTAGLRETEDVVENIGIQKAKEKAENARLILNMIDATSPENPEVKNSGERIDVFNKVDLLKNGEIENLKIGHPDALFISAKTGEGLNDLLERLKSFANESKGDGEGVVVSNLRHLQALQSCSEALTRSLDGIDNGMSSELVAMDVRQALHFLGEITGEVSTDDLLGNIFSRFCIGK